jgi:hypothetical protein
VPKIAQNTGRAFDRPELTDKTISSGQEAIGRASFFEALPISETELKGGILLLSVDSNTCLSSESKHEYLQTSERSEKKPKRTINRKRIIYDDTFTLNGKTYQVNATKSGLYAEILKSIIEQFQIALLKWKRVFVLRFDLHTHAFSEDNKRITAFRKRLFEKLKRQYGFKDIGFCWVREHERAKAQHYHFVLFLDGRLIKHSSKIIPMIKAAWEDGTGTYTVPYIKHPFHFADSEDVIKKAVYRVSYLAKPRGKGYRPSQTKDFQCSRMKL